MRAAGSLVPALYPSLLNASLHTLHSQVHVFVKHPHHKAKALLVLVLYMSLLLPLQLVLLDVTYRWCCPACLHSRCEVPSPRGQGV